MSADTAILAVLARLESDAALVDLLGGVRIYRSGNNEDPQIPSVEYRVVSSPLRENTVRVLVQFDVWAYGLPGAKAIQDRLVALLHRDLPEEVEGVPMWLQYQDSRDNGDPDPRVVHRSVDFLFEPAREF